MQMSRLKPATAALRVGIDGRALYGPAAGVRRYVSQLMEAIVRVSPSTELFAVGIEGADTVPQGVIASRSRGSLPTNAGWMLTGLPLAVHGLGLHVFHAPAYTAPLVGTPPVVLTVHDVSYARRPEDYPYHLDPARRWFYRASARSASAIITDSAFSAAEIEAAYSIPGDRITVVPLAADARFSPSADAALLPELAGAPYVLHVGDLHARRRAGLLLDAVIDVRSRHASLKQLSLVLIGRDHGEGAQVLARAADAGAPDAARWLGHRSDEDLVAALRGASAFVYASRYEGFGLPVLEALACGTPVVATYDASVPEIVGDAGCLVRDATASRFADALSAVLLRPEEAERLRRAGPRRAAQFSWDRTALDTIAVYDRVARRRS